MSVLARDAAGAPSLGVVMPAHDEAEVIEATLRELHATLAEEGIEHEIVVVDDHSADGTGHRVEALAERCPSIRCVRNHRRAGFGRAVRTGIEQSGAGCVAVMMADGSDSPRDLVRFYRELCERDLDAVFGTRFSAGGKTYDYPRPKLVLNRLANNLIRVLFRLRYDDVTNAFKLYRRETIEGLQPLLAPHFNITVELPLKVIVRGYRYTWLPNTWRNRSGGESKFRIREMGSRYLFIILYCLIEKFFSRGDYRKRE